MNKRIVFSDNGTLIDCSNELKDYRSNSKVIPFVAAQDKLYIGSRLPFNHLYFKLKVVNAITSTMTVKYYDGSNWVPVVELMDETNGWKNSGFVTFTPNRDTKWQMTSTNYGGETVSGLTTLNIYDMYWIQISFSADLTGTTELAWAGQLFSNDDDLCSEFTDLRKSNVMYAFESGKSDWQEQHAKAGELMVQDLINKGIISDGDNILSREDYTAASVQKCAEIIFNGFGDAYKDNKESARIEYERRLNKRINRVDVNKSGAEETKERYATSGWVSR